ncbi:DUF2393 domain-containing protein [Sulfurimonas aquatica]|uniref:DUF2393 domain-containing protein n=1 Tax=Sulfurimonas aquatica TaxID=2672570 RepID=A0A975AYF9_9BACT|nr:DUF2393 domain-containing protein [Sulfurimonas aquatica]QSZ40906.1 DUF2393 domain-containing protein [Sulfurimonas aquatica]
MKSKITEFINNLIFYDFILYGATFFFFAFFIILAIVFKDKAGRAFFFVLLGFSSFLTGPTLGYHYMHKALFKNSTEIISQKRLSFTEAVVLKGTITNESARDFKSCIVTASVYKVTSNKYRNYLYEFKPFKNMSMVVDDIMMAQTKEFKLIIEPFTYKRDYNISLEADCK